MRGRGCESTQKQNKFRQNLFENQTLLVFSSFSSVENYTAAAAAAVPGRGTRWYVPYVFRFFRKRRKRRFSFAFLGGKTRRKNVFSRLRFGGEKRNEGGGGGGGRPVGGGFKIQTRNE